MSKVTNESDLELTRRELLVVIAAGTASSALPANALAADSAKAGAAADTVKVSFEVNGTPRTLELEPRTTLLDTLREHLHLTGTKKGCDHGQCGACTVIVNGRRMVSCLSLGVMHEGDRITTIEGLGTPDKLHPMQAAFVKHDGFQCGYCTPGQICSAVAMLEEIRSGIPSHVSASLIDRPPMNVGEISERMSGNLCRCGAYSNIHEAIAEVARSRT